ncbi:Uncharacterised protein [[Flavobacterium] thermophilum]|nr:Uncharacterised protein [[Flavobacterium] thermophilum]
MGKSKWTMIGPGLIGGVGGSITMASYGYWLQENGWKGRAYVSPMLLHFIGKPVGLIIAYGALGALFMPFLAVTLLYLLNSKKALPDEGRNHWLSNALLVLCLALFAVLSINELIRLFA